MDTTLTHLRTQVAKSAPPALSPSSVPTISSRALRYPSRAIQSSAAVKNSARCSSSVFPRKSRSTRTCTGFRSLGHLEDQPAIRQVTAHDGDADHAVRRKVALMQCEGRRCRLGRVDQGGSFFTRRSTPFERSQTARLLGETRWRLGTAVGVAYQRPKGGCVDDGRCRHVSSSRKRDNAFIILILPFSVRAGGGFSHLRMVHITPRPSSTHRPPAVWNARRSTLSGWPAYSPYPSPIASPSLDARSARRRTSGNHPLPLRSTSASVAISPFFR